MFNIVKEPTHSSRACRTILGFFLKAFHNLEAFRFIHLFFVEIVYVHMQSVLGRETQAGRQRVCVAIRPLQTLKGMTRQKMNKIKRAFRETTAIKLCQEKRMTRDTM